ncbi:MAG: SDR family NAD(P)-dependent oxidoreductase [Candidatus Heimdallarchaeaceae archaeon]|jgi:NAD(P)-dependent dehydrogenase (short-subunit alcohol dehydrogenase family)
MNAMKDSKKVVLLTGVTGGIGSVTAELLHNKGYKVYGTTRNLNSAPRTPYSLVQLDVTDETSVKECVNGVIAKEGKIDILINNAGFGLCGALKDITTEELKEQFDTNFFGVHRTVNEVVPFMIKQEEGRIINVGTFGGRLGLPFQGAYSAAKAALAVYTDALKIELLRDKLKVSLIEPGDTRTDFNAGRRFAKGYDEDPDAQRAVKIMYEAEQKGTVPEKVAKTILKAIKSRNPKPRYIRGPDTIFFGILMRIMPYTIHSLIARWYYGVPKKRKSN